MLAKGVATVSDSKTLSEAVGIAERFTRSVNLEMDYTEARSLEGYVLTPVAKSLLLRVAQGMANDSTQRA